MNSLINWFYSINDNANAYANAGVGPNEVGPYAVVGPNESCIIRKFKPNSLEQGKTLHREQSRRSDALRSNMRVMNERIMNERIMNERVMIEGFGTMTANKNSAQITDTTTLSEDFDKKIDRYTKEYPVFIDEMRTSGKLNDRNENEITYEKEGCYKYTGTAGLELQTDLKEVNANTCKMRASDLGYKGFALKKGANEQLGCYLLNDVTQFKTNEIATKPMTSFAFKKSTSANMGGLLPNGQLGIYTNTIDNNLVTDFTEVPGCDAKGSDIFINENSVVATFGLNCNMLNSAAAAPVPAVASANDKNKIAIDFINTAFTYLDQISLSVKNITAARDQNANNFGLASFNYVTLAKQQLTTAIASINSNNYTQAVANINSALPNIANGAAFCVTALAYIKAGKAATDYVALAGTTAKQNVLSAINALEAAPASALPAAVALPAPAVLPAPAAALPAAAADKNKIAIDFINTAFTYLDQILLSVKNITAAGNQIANNFGLAAFNSVILAKQQLAAAISAINSNNYTQATASINSALPNIANGTASCIKALAFIKAGKAATDYVALAGDTAKQNALSAVNALA